ncbi:Hpt domain-containing protein [Roseinatronobacter bogoriensis subsp. barguzinensis]|uniref:Hpt domain-containing protein n=2 Tax=Roseinatronobacter bogoriensis TaxID=119542 RepID=A0A2K8KD44_9RHOB|nr:Hpt domain-containing protein [Rhodobaca barguzinensis]TDW38848.1 Hpt domain-containing protein [Rhodobaca barguzinensis]TDY68969.1 Hpt domain-containing protein [Rhodobaca bogoriensis DSM 18756]
MTARICDQMQLDALLSLGGRALSDQFVADLARCETHFIEALGVASTDKRQGLELARRALHELRGIALTVGATSLSRQCAKAEALCDLGHLQDVVEARAEILATCDALTKLIRDYPEGTSL